ncbi:hypothetical protein HMF7854_00680 [Sphingomonas ginkgonis]|uniref:Uncharacterized protein n=1 Tax=Sphingomonas ginkgonis TaxID=2315330 RepID=A0A3R9YGN5_9SPHN|nr:hypothetical protein [Sphingomonas ginkgonis]RST29509.1 hypothetical protein HMF7854_00680 [Sphingomonas ginkgonis]
MLVYGDHEETVSADARLDELRDRRERANCLSPGLERHAALAGLFIGLAGLAQGVADRDFAAAGEDRARPTEAALLDGLVSLGHALVRSWQSDFADAVPIPSLPKVLFPGDEVRIRLAEGHAFYVLYPEAYALAAEQLQLLAPPRIIGLRSIGSGLACMAAAVLDADRPTTLRPSGDPFARELRIDAELSAKLLDGVAHYVVVDEGPGLSGSSFGAVADWLASHGVPEERIAFLPGHAGPLGAQASERHRQRWARAQRPIIEPNALLGPRLPTWVTSQVGELREPLVNLSGGAWRAEGGLAEFGWPAINPMWEATKYRVRTADGAWQVRFAGIGKLGEQRLALARRLHHAGFGAETAGLAYGWLVQRWHEDAVASAPTIDELAAYLQVRAALPATSGATLDELVVMARHNAPRQLGKWQPDTKRLTSLVSPVAIDGRMQRHEWLRVPSGQLLKTDATDHHCAHDLVGPQDIAWDVAGAILELDLASDDATRLARSLNSDPALLDFMLRAYAAFRIGAHRLSADMLGHWPAEADRNRAAADEMEAKLDALVAAVDAVEHAGHVD